MTPYLACGDGDAAIEFYKKALGAIEKVRMPGPDGKVAHAEVAIGDSRIMGTVQDPFGHVWHLAAHVEDVSPKELKKRAGKSTNAMS